MSFWGSKGSGGIKPVKPQIRVEKIPVANKTASSLAAKKSASLSSQTMRLSPKNARVSPGRKSVATPPTTDGDSDSSRLQVRKRKATTTSRRKQLLSPDKHRVLSDSSDDDGSETTFDGLTNGVKRQRRDGPVDYKRKLKSKLAFGEADGGPVTEDIIHAADITSPSRRSKSGDPEPVLTVELKYPSLSRKERYAMVFELDKIEPLEEISTIAKVVTDVYLMEEQRRPFTDPNAGILRKLERAKNMFSRDRKNNELRDKVMDAVEVYNKALDKLVRDGAIADTLDDTHHLPRDMVQLILRQVYDRAVSPKVDILKQYENGTDNVYGELLFPFISEIFKKTNLKSDQVVVDLGSGVGNVILQAALEVGCESWGCEMMENACQLAAAQEKEFAARCRLWGIETGEVHLVKGDFLEDETIHKAMRRADVILVNNQAFTSSLNRRLIDLFLDVKDGCKIVSLKSFVPQDHKITSRNADDPVNVLDVKRQEYGSGSVSWTGKGGEYYIARKDGKRLEEFSRMS